LSQILSKNSLLNVNWETVTEEGYLNNPYRSYRIKDTSLLGYSYELENQKYPRTRTSNALAFRLKYFLPYRAALSSEYRYFHDTWGISASNIEIGYTHPLKENWIFDVRYRYYTQNAALFYSDLFTEEKTYMGRDKELSSYRDQTIGLGVSYEFKPEQWSFIDRGSLNLSLDYIRFDYNDFRDVTAGGPAGEEPLFSFSANVIKAYLSIWY
jgi:predicted porin